MLKDTISSTSAKKETIIASLKSVIKDLSGIQGASDGDDNKMVEVACKLHKVIGVVKGI